MPSAIIYCEKCGTLIPPSDVERSRAVIFGDAGVCSQCASSMPPAELKAIRSRFPSLPDSAKAPPRIVSPSARGPGSSQRHAAAGAGGTAARPRTGVAALAIVGGLLVGAGIVYVVTSRPPSETGGPAVDESAGPSNGKPAGKPTVRRDAAAAGDSAARRRLDEIKSMTASSLDRYAEAREALVRFAAESDDRACAAEAEALVTKIDADFMTFADGELAKAMESVDALISNDKLAEARKAVEGFGERFAGTEWFRSRGGKAIAKELAEIDAVRLEAVKALVARASAALESEDFDAARAALEARAGWPGEFRAQAEDIVRKIAEAEAAQAARAKLAAAWGAFPPGFMAAGRQGLEPAKAFLEEQREDLAELGAGAGIKATLGGIKRLFRGAALVEDLAEVGFKGTRGTVYFHWNGERVGGKIKGVDGRTVELTTTRGRNLKVPIAEIAPADVVRHSRILRQRTSEKSRAAAYLFLRGDPEAAREVLKGASGAGVREIEDRIAEFMQTVEEEKERRKREAAKAEAARIAAEAREAAAKMKALADAAAARHGAALKASLVAHWKFDDGEGTVARDSSGKENHGTVMGGANWGEGKVGGALAFSGRDGRVKLPDGFADFTRGITVALWAKPVGPPACWQRFIEFAAANGQHNILFARQETTANLSFEVYPGNIRRKTHVSADGAIEQGVWQHFAATVDGTGRAVLYKNGHEIARGRCSLPRRVLRTLNYIGKSFFPRDAHYEGMMDDFRIYSRALSAEQIEHVFTERPVVATAPPESTPETAPAEPGREPDERPDGTSGPAAPQEVIVKNGGFEEKGTSGFASEWKKEQWGARGAGSSVRLDRSNPRTGDGALVVRGLADGSRPGASTVLRLEPGTYEVRYWASADVGRTATIGVRFAGKELAGHEVPDRWTQFTETVTVEKRNLNSGLGLWTSTANVRVWFDDVELLRR